MKFNKNQNTTNKLDTSSYTDELFGIKKELPFHIFRKELILFQKLIQIMFLMRQQLYQLLWVLSIIKEF